MRPRSKFAGLSVLQLMLKFSIVQTGTFKVFERQCLSRAETDHPYRGGSLSPARFGQSANHDERDTINVDRKRRPSCSEPIQKLAGVRRLALWLNTATLCFYYFTIVKYALILLLRLDLLADYQFVDCFILGRFRFMGHGSRLSEPILMQFVFVYIIYRHVTGVIAPKQFKFYALEFLLDSYKDVLRKSTLHKLGKTSRAGEPPVHHHRDGLKIEDNEPQCRTSHANYYLRCLFELVPSTGGADQLGPTKPGASEWILRPNRSVRSWLILARFTNFAFFLSLLIVSVWLVMLYYMVLGLVVTRTGFELAYGPACLVWIRRQQRLQLAARNTSIATRRALFDWSLIYTPGDKLAHEMHIDQQPAIIPLDDFIQFNLYGTIRLAIDLLESAYWYIEFSLYAIALMYLFASSALDCMLSARELKKQLERIVEQMVAGHDKSSKLATQEHQSTAGVIFVCKPVPSGGGGGQRPSSKSMAKQPLQNDTRCDWDHHYYPADSCRSNEIAKLQATLVEHFAMVKDYNSYLSFLISCLLAIWCLWTIILCFAMLYLNSRAIEREFIYANTLGASIMLMFFSIAAAARSYNCKLYPLIARAMALDEQHSTRRRWMTIIRYYYPKPLYCFTIFGGVEVSWLFCLKVSAL
jgi:hypothetical protein